MSQDRLLRYRIPELAVQAGLMVLMFVLSLVILYLLVGNREQALLEEIRDGNRALVCVLILPVGEEGRDEGETNGSCLIPNGIAPVDANRDGHTEIDP